MTRNARIGIGVGIAALLALALLTVLNKRWWARRVMLKWKLSGDGDISKNDELIKHTTLADFVRMYREGQPGWTLRSAATTTEVASSDMPEAKSSRNRPARGTAFVN